MMSEDLDGVLDPSNLQDESESLGSIEFMGLRARYSCASVTLQKEETRYYMTLLDDINPDEIIDRDWTDFVVKGIGRSFTVKKEDIVRMKISPKAIKLRFRRHTYSQG